MQNRDGGMVEQTHDFEDQDEAKEFGQGLGADAHAQLFDMDKEGDEQQTPVWSADTPQATEKERDGARAANVVGKSEGSGPNTKADTREDKPQDLKEIMGNKPQDAQAGKPMDEPSGAAPQGTRQLDADKGDDKTPQDGSRNRGLSQDGSSSSGKK
jgi:hypothetical protein